MMNLRAAARRSLSLRRLHPGAQTTLYPTSSFGVEYGRPPTACHLTPTYLVPASLTSRFVSTIVSNNRIATGVPSCSFGYETVSSNIPIRSFSSVTSDDKEKEAPALYSKQEELTFRANAKLDALNEARTKRKDAKRAYEASRYDDEMLNNDESTAELSNLLDEWLEAEQNLSQAYQKAVKYVARTRDADSALRAQRLLEEMTERAGAPPTEYPLDGEKGSTAASSTKLKGQVMIKMISGRRQDRDGLMPDISNVPFPPPDRSDFMNVLRSWNQSKARKKGLYAEALLLRMAELSYWYPDTFDTLPDSKAFSMVVQCHAGSTHSSSLTKILHLHAIHSAYAQRNIHGVHQDDPFFLIGSLKALKNYRDKEQLELGDAWMSRLHSFLMDPANREYHVSNTKEAVHDGTEGDESAPRQRLVNATAAYTSHIRELARLRGTDGAAALARTTLDRMHEIAGDETSIAFMDIKENAYNLVLGLYKDCREEGYTTEALRLLDKMIDSWKQRDDVSVDGSSSASAVPFPNAYSFIHCIQSLASIKDTSVVLKEVVQLLDEFESMCDDDSSFMPNTFPYNAAIETFTKSMHHDPLLLSHTSDVVARMNEVSEKYSEVEPDVKTSSLVLKACALAIHAEDESEKAKALSTANSTFKELEENESLEDEKTRMTDSSYFHMMKCVANLVLDEDEKQTRIKELFASACDKGLCSADVIRLFRNSVSEEDFTAKVGSGRLADNWIANVSGGKAYYTDGAKGGEGKNARRKGKSTSDWAKKQRKKEANIQRRKVAKAQRKFQRKQRQGAAM